MKNQNYIDLLKFTLTDFHRMEDVEHKPLINLSNSFASYFFNLFNNKILKPFNLELMKRFNTSKEHRMNGLDWPASAETMIGLKRLENIEKCICDIVREKVDGDFIETGVWRGGAVIFMKALLNEYNLNDRKVFVADSFEGIPKPDVTKYIEDKGDRHYQWKELSIGELVVRENFRKYNLLDENVIFLKGWFKDTLKTAPIQKLALMRLDGDMYESTMDALVPLYPKLEVDGYVIIDDYNGIPACKAAVTDYRQRNDITDEIMEIDTVSVYWKKTN